MTQVRTARVDHAPAAVVERLVALAGLAPSVHNTQPWLWEYVDQRLTLHADHRRQLAAEDPSGRNLTISCGAALHHLEFAASALGWETAVHHLPVPSDRGVLAEVVVGRTGPHPVDAEAIRLLRERCTDRRRFTAWPVPGDRLDTLCRTAALWGAEAQAVTDEASRFRLELLANQALTTMEFDRQQRAEQDSWIDRADAAGIPHALLPHHPDPLQARSRFQPGLLEDARLALHGCDRVIAIGSAADDVEGWIVAGQALSAVWLEAARQGLSVVPMSQPIEDADARAEITRDVLGSAFVPHILLRVGWQAMGRRELARTPRRPLQEVLNHRALRGAKGPDGAGIPTVGEAQSGP
ncbi:nitroreductase family protein [Nocardioides sp. WS12]|uniref:Acg family FMN-binding oxidoreductase n=1 Tax=Nocardioides sp. WS12 TaxID=2486272 RepID=UPI0015F9503F|nr:nitroreductase family protein [Nocardioides sp. WS12]